MPVRRGTGLLPAGWANRPGPRNDGDRHRRIRAESRGRPVTAGLGVRAMAEGPKLTIGVPVYNGATYLEAAVESILGQSFDDFELIISDNASTDDTEAIGRRLAARGPLFKWAAADDALLPGYLARCVERLDAEPDVVLVYAKTAFIDGSGAPLDIEDPGWHLVADDPSVWHASAIT